MKQQKSTKEPPMIPKPQRAVGYCRTSGEGQRDNTSIGSQKEAIAAFCKREGWPVVDHYVDECRSGAKVAVRDEFQRLMHDAARGKFDIVAVYQVSRWGRDGAGIIDSCHTLKRDFGINVVETAGSFDTRKPANTLMNFVGAGFAEQERLTILQRTITGRMAKAKDGQPWCGNPPVGRTYDPASGAWSVSELGRGIAAVLKRYVEGESLTKVATEYGIRNPKWRFSKWLTEGQLAGTYHARFEAPDIGLDEDIPVPAIPEVVSAALLERAKAKAAHNRQWNRADVTQYKLTGFVFCKVCGRALGGRTDYGGRLLYYTHHAPGCSCGFRSVRGEQLEEQVLDALYTFFQDEPRFNKALSAAMPTPEQRADLERQRRSATKQLTAVEVKISRLVAAVADGVDAGLLRASQEALKADQASAQKRLEELDGILAEMPSADEVGHEARLLRLDLAQRFRDEDWRGLNCADVKNFLSHLFGVNPRKAGTGIFVSKTDRGIDVELRGSIDLGILAKVRKAALESGEIVRLKAACRQLQTAKARREKLATLIEAAKYQKAKRDRLTAQRKALDAEIREAEAKGDELTVRIGRPKARVDLLRTT